MKIITNIIASLSVVTVFLLAAVIVPATPVSAHNGEDHSDSVVTQAQEEQSGDAASYTYVAQKGDSYTLLARKAVQTYGITQKVNLTEGQIIFAETNLTKEAGSPKLGVGQEVTVNQDAVKSWVEKAGQLTDAQKAAWDYYAQFANFNTNAVGQAR